VRATARLALVVGAAEALKGGSGDPRSIRARGPKRSCYTSRMPLPAPIRILGVDPGLRNTGWGVIDCQGTRISYVACGSVHSDGKLTLADRLRQLHEGLAAVLHAHQPDEAAVEETFVNKDATATLKLGHARGIALLVPAQAGISVAEYAPNLVKKTIVGSGHAEKDQIHMMVKVLLPRCEPRSADAADALAVALTHAQHRGARAMERALLTRLG
jgi:crossover junction endodeoxyribonuclease RuvC